MGISKELGYIGQALPTFLPIMSEDLVFPQSITTYKKMALNSTVNAALQLYYATINRAEWYVVPYDDKLRNQKRAEFVEQCFNDMDRPFSEFLKEVATYLTFGFSIHEIVLKYRDGKDSRFDDMRVGIKRLPIRPQDTIKGFRYTDDGREITHVVQLRGHNPYSVNTIVSGVQNTSIEIPYNRVLNFRVNPQYDCPVGTSPLRGAYLPWKYLVRLKDIEAVSISKNLTGLPHLKLHPVYMSEDASPEQKAVYEYYKTAVSRLQRNEDSGLITPLQYDDAGKPMFDFELLSAKSDANSLPDTPIRRYVNEILQALSADVLILGEGTGGSYNLNDSKTTLLYGAIQDRLKEIADEINNVLIRRLFEANGWDTNELPRIQFRNTAALDLETFSKAVQRIAAVGLLEVDRDVLNYVRRQLEIQEKPEDAEVDFSLLSNSTSRAGDGIAKGSLNGTSDSVATVDTSVANTEN